MNKNLFFVTIFLISCCLEGFAQTFRVAQIAREICHDGCIANQIFSVESYNEGEQYFSLSPDKAELSGKENVHIKLRKVYKYTPDEGMTQIEFEAERDGIVGICFYVQYTEEPRYNLFIYHQPWIIDGDRVVDGCVKIYFDTEPVKKHSEILARYSRESESLDNNASTMESEVRFEDLTEQPTFMGGDVNTFSKWVNSKLVYPKLASENGIQGRVTLQFTIDTDGKLQNVKILRSPDTLLSQEATRVVLQSPRWTPGKKGDIPVKVTYTFPVIFQLRKNNQETTSNTL